MEQACIDKICKSHQLNPQLIRSFQTEIYTYYQNHKRNYPWRETRDPYHILVSEIMLQQTQTNRSVDKYRQFIETFPNFKALAKAPLHDILTQWHGLGYNRRAIQLKQLSEIVLTTYNGKLPSTIHELRTLPGIGPYTAAAICAFAFNQPTVLIETNIRSVMLYFFFQGKSQVKDSELIKLIQKTLDAENPREWYYALIDFGAMLKKKYSITDRIFVSINTVG
jgi:A/G-specific adenine glycosylase